MIGTDLIISAGASGTLSINDSATVSARDSITLDDGAILLSGGTLVTAQLSLSSSTTLSGNGTVFVGFPGPITDNDIISSATGTLSLLGPINGTGSLVIAGNSDLFVENATTVGIANFAGSNGMLSLGDAPDFSTPITNFQQTDTIDVQDIIANNYTYDTSNGQLVLENGVTPVGTLTVPGVTDPSLISLKPDGNNGTDIYLACFAPKTRVASPDGPRQVEHLQPGDQVRTSSGAVEAIQWIGYRTLDLTRHPHPACAQPIRIRRSAFAPGLPRSDLRLSPDHALFIDGMLIPVRLLVNNATITQETDCAYITYFHIELPRDNIRLAEDLPVESYLDTGNRGMFENADEPMILHPDFGQERRETESCAPFATDPDRIQPIWQRLQDRATEFGYASNNIDTTDGPDVRIEAAGRTITPVHARDGRPAPRRSNSSPAMPGRMKRNLGLRIAEPSA